jgi:nucleotide-binding universal stress UspA family protein
MYKTIVVHVDGQAQQASRLQAAAWLAAEHGAHVVGSAATGISWADFALLTGSAGAPMPIDDFTAMRDAASANLRAFEEQAQRLGVESVETRLIEDMPDDALLLESRYADLVVLSRDSAAPGPGGTAAHARSLPERVCLHGVRPVLVVPGDWRGPGLDGPAVVGWDGGTCALRAIAAALPLLQRAPSVELALVNPDQFADLHGDEPGADMATYLSRQGVKVDAVVERTHTTVGNALISLARYCGATLMVSGAYGHSRFREWVLGGVTRELLERAPVPLLLAH